MPSLFFFSAYKVTIFGKFYGGEIGNYLTLKITKPDGEISTENIRIASDDVKFTYQYLIKRDFPIG